jgi:putative aldouronate transport system substrate-binding protein
MKKAIALVLSIMLILTLGLQAAAIKAVNVTGIKLDPSKITLDVGQTKKLNVTFVPATTTQKFLTYTTGNKKIASVDATGKITAVSSGTTSITVISNSNKKVFAKCEVTVAKKLPPVSVSWYVVNTPQKDTDAVVKEVNKMLAAKGLNTTLDYKVLDWNTYDSKLNVMMQAGEALDICFTASWINNFLGNVARGAFTPLNELLAKYGQNIKSQVEDKYWAGTTVAGKIYGIPNYQGFAQPKGLTFRKDLADKYKFNYKGVRSLRDIEPLLEKIKANEPGVIPFMPISNGNTLAMLDTGRDGFNAFLDYEPETGKTISKFEDPEVMDMLKLLRSWYLKGYLAKDAATRKDFSAEQKSGKYAVMESGAYYNNGTKTTKDYGYPTYDVPVGKVQFLTTGSFQGALNAISKTSKHPDRAIMLLDAIWADKKIYNTLGFGLEGKHWNWVDAEKTTIKTADNSGYGSPIMWELGSAFNKYYTVEENKSFMDPQEEFNKKTPASPILGFIYDQSKMKNECAQLDALYNEKLFLLFSGSVDPVETVNEMMEKARKIGLDKVQADIEQQLAQWKKDNGK